MKKSVLGLLLQRGRVLLAPRKDGRGLDNLSSYGGGVKRGESLLAALVRETFEEGGLRIRECDLTLAAVITTYRADVPEYKLSAFTCRKWRGVPRETKEMGIPQWFPFNTLPFDRMWPGDRIWLPKILAGEPFFKADVHLNKRGELARDVSYHGREASAQEQSRVLRA